MELKIPARHQPASSSVNVVLNLMLEVRVRLENNLFSGLVNSIQSDEITIKVPQVNISVVDGPKQPIAVREVPKEVLIAALNPANESRLAVANVPTIHGTGT
jgi:hypothetical protein